MAGTQNVIVLIRAGERALELGLEGVLKFERTLNSSSRDTYDFNTPRLSSAQITAGATSTTGDHHTFINRTTTKAMQISVARKGLSWWVTQAVTESINAAQTRGHFRPVLLRSNAVVAVVTKARPATWGA